MLASKSSIADRPLAEAFPYVILDARYERVREAGVIASQAVLIAIGIDWDGRRQVLAVELAFTEADGCTSGFKALLIWSPAASIPIKPPHKKLGAPRRPLGLI